MLTDKQERFCREYVVDLNGKQAAIRTGYSEDTAENQASRLLSNVKVSEFIKKLQLEISDELGIKAVDVVRELWALGKYSVKDFVKEDNNIKQLSEMERQTLIPVVGIKVTERTTSGDWGSETVVTTDLKLSDKISALEKVGKHLGVFEKDNIQKKQSPLEIIIKGNVSDLKTKEE